MNLNHHSDNRGILQAFFFFLSPPSPELVAGYLARVCGKKLFVGTGCGVWGVGCGV
ncbi:hypothetical protein [Microcystis aeruginosa]|uniref:hypothetical protein n=1 Tax=Microcystis aeruginosa TaxID=1126 RepID=UPI00131444F7|nr:hypothetical protein [Microcystis aeruginosa]